MYRIAVWRCASTLLPALASVGPSTNSIRVIYKRYYCDRYHWAESPYEWPVPIRHENWENERFNLLISVLRRELMLGNYVEITIATSFKVIETDSIGTSEKMNRARNTIKPNWWLLIVVLTIRDSNAHGTRHNECAQWFRKCSGTPSSDESHDEYHFFVKRRWASSVTTVEFLIFSVLFGRCGTWQEFEVFWDWSISLSTNNTNKWNTMVGSILYSLMTNTIFIRPI